MSGERHPTKRCPHLRPALFDLAERLLKCWIWPVRSLQNVEVLDCRDVAHINDGLSVKLLGEGHRPIEYDDSFRRSLRARETVEVRPRDDVSQCHLDYSGSQRFL